MLSIGLNEADRSNVWRIAACVLHIGNVDFEETFASGDSGSVVSEATMPALNKAAELMAVPPELFARLISTHTISGVDGKIFKPLTVANARGNIPDWL